MLLEEDLKNVPLLVFANKQDLTFALSAQEIAEKLALDASKSANDLFKHVLLLPRRAFKNAWNG